MGGVICAADNAATGPRNSFASGDSSPADRPSWCHAGWECLPTSEIADTGRQIADLKEQVIRARGKRLGWTIGPTIGIGAVVTDRFDVKYVPMVGLGLTFGWRSK